MKVGLLFPHQLFYEHPMLEAVDQLYLVEEQLYFKEFNFHKRKLAFHRASMKVFYQFLLQSGKKVTYVESKEVISDIRQLIPQLAQAKASVLHFIEPTDDWLERRIQEQLSINKLAFKTYDNPSFLNSRTENATYFRADKKSFFQTDFYKRQRKKRNLLLDGDQPLGGKWSFDAENRKRYPKHQAPPAIEFPKKDDFWKEAVHYVETNFTNNLGLLNHQVIYPYTTEQTKDWLQQFLHHRFHQFGDYEDAIVAQESVLNHSVLTPMLNVGLIAPQTILDQAIAYAAEHDVPINSLEGFVRQIIGWREFIRGMYDGKGRYSRTQNFWGFHRSIPKSLYEGTTGIEPVDQTIRKVLQTGYCHHIERLMVLGNFMLLCEFHPNEVYRWFMELFIDAYDWVMVPNVYGMSQFADAGTFATKPYISGSNYILKMSNYKKGDWQQSWDGLFWRFMHVNRDFFLKNPRLGMLVRTFDKMPQEKQQAHLKAAETFLERLN